jgi:hypothetical protein
MSEIQGLGASQNVRPALPALRTSPVRPELPIETPSSFGNDAVQMSGGTSALPPSHPTRAPPPPRSRMPTPAGRFCTGGGGGWLHRGGAAAGPDRYQQVDGGFLHPSSGTDRRHRRKPARNPPLPGAFAERPFHGHYGPFQPERQPPGLIPTSTHPTHPRPSRP